MTRLICMAAAAILAIVFFQPEIQKLYDATWKTAHERFAWVIQQEK